MSKTSSPIYDRIGLGYAQFRQPDPRIESAIDAALGDAESVVNVGAGAGSYEPTQRAVTAVEPSAAMIAQRPRGPVEVVQASAEALPFADNSFDAALAILTVHHWASRSRGLSELARVARQRVVVFTWDPNAAAFWLTEDYFPELLALDQRIFPTVSEFQHNLGGHVSSEPVAIPHDCSDGFLAAYWRRPELYLEDERRAAISSFTKLADPQPALDRLRADLSSGAWERRHGNLRAQTALDVGYRLVSATL